MKPLNKPADQQMWRKHLQKSGSFMAIFAVNFALFLLLGTAVIWHVVAPQEEPPMTFVKVKTPAVPPPPKPPAHGGEAAKASVDPTVTVSPPTTSVSSVVVSSNPVASFSMQSLDPTISNVSLPSFAPPSGSGLAQGSGATGVAHSNPFGDAVQDGVPGLIGQLYDLKQTPDGTPTKSAMVAPETPGLYPQWRGLPATQESLVVLRKYVQNWDQEILDQYYKSPVALQTTQLIIPKRRSEEATKAFGVADKVIAKRWVIHYHANIVPPKSGRFRFLGFGDDFLVVRLGSQNVLDACWGGEELDPSANSTNRTEPVIPAPLGYSGTIRRGKWVNLDQGVVQSIDILIGEGPGGDSSFYLLVEEEGDNGAYSVFQIAPTELPKDTKLPDTFTGKTMVFVAQ